MNIIIKHSYNPLILHDPWKIVKEQSLFVEDFKIQIRQRILRVCIKQTKKRGI